jgi:hypothetical protein
VVAVPGECLTEIGLKGHNIPRNLSPQGLFSMSCKTLKINNDNFVRAFASQDLMIKRLFLTFSSSALMTGKMLSLSCTNIQRAATKPLSEHQGKHIWSNLIILACIQDRFGKNFYEVKNNV